MNMNYVNLPALINLIESNWAEFVELCGGDEVSADDTVSELKKQAGMS
jgi:hypothetical protein